MSPQSPDSLLGWYPTSLDPNAAGELQLTWRNLYQTRFCEPFFEMELTGASRASDSVERMGNEALMNRGGSVVHHIMESHYMLTHHPIRVSHTHC